MDDSLLALRVDCLATLEHFDESFDFLFSAGFGSHVVEAECQSEPVLRVELLEHLFRFGLGIDG